VAAIDGTTFASLSPIDGRKLALVAAGEARDVDAAVKVARIAFERGDWSHQAPAARKRALQRFAELIEAATEELALLKPLTWASRSTMR
jgi:gamma-glutamyl-gamma-aminobutyraldehyde dehydrogenase